MSVMAITSKMFGLTGVYTAAIGTNNYGGDPMYFLTFGLMCLAIASTAGLSISKVTLPEPVLLIEVFSSYLVYHHLLS